MIFRKPNAFIIKYIKLIHGIILFCMIYLLIKTSAISSFYAHVVEVKSIVGESNLHGLFNIYMFIALFLAIALTFIILLLLIKKKRKFLFYLITIIVLGCVLVFDVLAYENIDLMQKEVVDAPIYMAFDDISTILFYVQSIFIVIYLVKATGFDIKTFNFGKNIIGLDLTEEDSEEVEVDFEIDANEIKTARKRKLRYLKYNYLENKLKINLIVFLLISIGTVLTLYLIEKNKEIIYNEGDELITSNYSIIIKDTYATNLNYKAEKKYKNDYFVILMFDLKKTISEEYSFDSNRIYIELNDTKYYPTNDFVEDFKDFGTLYKNQKLTKDYNSYYVIYQIPYEFSTKEVYAGVASNFDYVNNRYNFYKIKLNYEKMMTEEKIKEYKLNNEMNIDAYGVHTNISILNVGIKDKYKLSYKYTNNKIDYDSVEYLVPTASNNEEKAILKLKYNQTYKENEKKYDFYNLISLFGSIEYEVEGTLKVGKFYSLLTPKNIKEENTYYIEVSKDVLEGTNIKIKIKIRDKVYKYSLEA